MEGDEVPRLGDEAPRFKDFIMVIIIVLILIAISWITYYKFGWFH